MADLPLDRISPHQHPFTNVGVDFLGLSRSRGDEVMQRGLLTSPQRLSTSRLLIVWTPSLALMHSATLHAEEVKPRSCGQTMGLILLLLKESYERLFEI